MTRLAIAAVAALSLAACTTEAGDAKATQNAIGGVLTGIVIAAIAEREGAFD